MWDEITDPFPNFNNATVEVWEWLNKIILHMGMCLLIHASINLINLLRITDLCDGNSPVNSPHKWPATRNMFPFDDVLMNDIGTRSPNGQGTDLFARHIPVSVCRGLAIIRVGEIFWNGNFDYIIKQISRYMGGHKSTAYYKRDVTPMPQQHCSVVVIIRPSWIHSPIIVKVSSLSLDNRVIAPVPTG